MDALQLSGISWLQFVVLCLASYRITLLIVDDTGPWDFLIRFRRFLKREARENPAVRKSKVQKGIECPRCSGLFMAVGIALYAFCYSDLPNWTKALGDVFLLALALNGATILIWRAFPERN